MLLPGGLGGQLPGIVFGVWSNVVACEEEEGLCSVRDLWVGM